MRRRPQALWTALLLAALTGCGDDAVAPEAPALTVTVAPVQDRVPLPATALTGVAEPYREAAVGFEVTGRLIAVMDVGRNVEVVTQRDENGTLVTRGEVLAQIDDTTYRQQLEAAQLRLASAKAGIKASRVDLERVAPASVARAKAQRDAALSSVESERASLQSAKSNEKTALAELERARKLLADRQISRAEFDQTENAAETATANVAKSVAGLQSAQEQVTGYEAAVTEAEASLTLKSENLARQRAELEELELAVRQAQTNLDRCTLHAPFAGRITQIHVSQGDLAQAGAPVVTLTLIDPIKVSVTVSAERERQIRPGQHAFVFPTDLEGFADGQDHLTGTVFEKGSVADAATRTFRIDIMVRNARRRPTVDGEVEGERPITFRQLLPAVERNFGEGGPLFVCDTCLAGDDGAQFVYRIPGARFGHPRSETLFRDKLPLEKVPVEPTGTGPDDYMQILNWTFRRVKPVAGKPSLLDGDLLLNFVRLSPSDVTEVGVRLERFAWAIRPGDLVPVRFDLGGLPDGLYVRDDAIISRNNKHSVFVVEDGTARERTVTVHESTGRNRRIEGEGLRAGTRVVVRGVHYCYDGARVTISADESDGE